MYYPFIGGESLLHKKSVLSRGELLEVVLKNLYPLLIHRRMNGKRIRITLPARVVLSTPAACEYVYQGMCTRIHPSHHQALGCVCVCSLVYDIWKRFVNECLSVYVCVCARVSRQPEEGERAYSEIFPNSCECARVCGIYRETAGSVGTVSVLG